MDEPLPGRSHNSPGPVGGGGEALLIPFRRRLLRPEAQGDRWLPDQILPAATLPVTIRHPLSQMGKRSLREGEASPWPCPA